MATGRAETVEAYLAALPPERREVVSRVRDVVRASLPPGYEEAVRGMISWEVPLARYPDTYNGQPLMYAALAAQKHHYALYLMCSYIQPEQVDELRRAHEAIGRRMDMGKSCLRFKRLEDLPLDAVGRIIARTTVDEYIAAYERARGGSKRR